MKNQKMTSYQFMMLMQQLPNPMHYMNTKMSYGPRIKISYLKYPVNDEPTILVNPKSSPIKLGEIEHVEFELVPNNNIWYWQPVEPITIITLDKRDYIKNWE